MSNHYEIRFSGSGGQGMMLLGDIIADAAGNYENKNIILTKSYGPESRGGACRSELTIDDEPINYPEVTRPNLVLAMTQLACDKYHSDMDPEGILLIDPMFVKKLPENVRNIYSLPMTQIAKEETGKEIAANVVAMGAIAVLGKFVKVDSVRKAILAHFPAVLQQANEKAFNAGISEAEKMLHEKCSC